MDKIFVYLLEETDLEDEEVHTHGIYSSRELADEATEVIIEAGDAAFDNSQFEVTKYELDA
jgi:hypothetical protein